MYEPYYSPPPVAIIDYKTFPMFPSHYGCYDNLALKCVKTIDRDYKCPLCYIYINIYYMRYVAIGVTITNILPLNVKYSNKCEYRGVLTAKCYKY